MLRNLEELEELLSRPSAADVEAMGRLGGDLLVLGAGGKMGPTLCLRAKRAAVAAGSDARIIAVSRFTEPGLAARLTAHRIECISADLLRRTELAALPSAPNILYLAGRKFGSTGNPSLTWMMNVYLPALVTETFQSSRIVALSSGNVYPLRPVNSGGAAEADAPAPVGEYAASVLGRDRMFEYGASEYGIPTAILRLNYANEMRYGVLADIGIAVFERRPVELAMGMVNVIWQGDANSVALRSFAHAASPARIINVAGPETLSVRRIAYAFGAHFGVDPIFTGQEANDALLNDSQLCMRLFGYPSMTPDEMIERISRWIGIGGAMHGKPTHFGQRDGAF